jgi:hypothetical protein
VGEANDDSGDEEQGEEDNFVEQVASDALEEKAVLAAAAEEGSDPCMLSQALQEHVQGQVQQVLQQALVNKGLQDFDLESAADGDPAALRKARNAKRKALEAEAAAKLVLPVAAPFDAMEAVQELKGDRIKACRRVQVRLRRPRCRPAMGQGAAPPWHLGRRHGVRLDGRGESRSGSAHAEPRRRCLLFRGNASLTARVYVRSPCYPLVEEEYKRTGDKLALCWARLVSAQKICPFVCALQTITGRGSSLELVRECQALTRKGELDADLEYARPTAAQINLAAREGGAHVLVTMFGKHNCPELEPARGKQTSTFNVMQLAQTLRLTYELEGMSWTYAAVASAVHK